MKTETLKQFAVETPGISPAARAAIEYVDVIVDMQEKGMSTPMSCSLSVPTVIAEEFRRFFIETTEFMRQRDLHDEWRGHLKLHGY